MLRAVENKISVDPPPSGPCVYNPATGEVSAHVASGAPRGFVGNDVLAGSDGDDVMRAGDGEADTLMSGVPGLDTAYYDGESTRPDRHRDQDPRLT